MFNLPVLFGMIIHIQICLHVFYILSSFNPSRKISDKYVFRGIFFLKFILDDPLIV